MPRVIHLFIPEFTMTRLFHRSALLSILCALTLATAACDSGPDGMDEDDRLEMERDQARADWPDHDGPAGQVVDLSAYDSVTLVPFKNLTDDSIADNAGYAVVEEVRNQLEQLYPNAYSEVRIQEEPLGQSGELVVRGQVFDFGKGGFAPYVGRISPRFECDIALYNGQSGEVIKSAEMKEKGEPNNMAMLREGATDIARLLGRGK